MHCTSMSRCPNSPHGALRVLHDASERSCSGLNTATTGLIRRRKHYWIIRTVESISTEYAGFWLAHKLSPSTMLWWVYIFVRFYRNLIGKIEKRENFSHMSTKSSIAMAINSRRRCCWWSGKSPDSICP